MPETTLEYLRRKLDLESQSEPLQPLPSDFYSNLAAYSQKLKRSAGSGSSDIAVRLTATQSEIIESMVRQLLRLRTQKAMRHDALLQLLPEERYVCSAEQKFQRRFETMVEAVSRGQPSFVEFAHLNEARRSVTVRFVKRVNELIGLDMRRYGPFEADDVASIPAASAVIFFYVWESLDIYTRDDV